MVKFTEALNQWKDACKVLYEFGAFGTDSFSGNDGFSIQMRKEPFYEMFGAEFNVRPQAPGIRCSRIIDGVEVFTLVSVEE